MANLSLRRVVAALPAVCAILPSVVLAIASLWWTAGVTRGAGLWPADRVSLPEAVATRNYGEVARLVGLGTDPNRREPVRSPLLANDDPISVTPLEAAVWTRDAYLVKLVLQSGAIVDRDVTTTLRCINNVEPDADVRRLLETLSQAPWPSCDDFHLPR